MNDQLLIDSIVLALLAAWYLHSRNLDQNSTLLVIGTGRAHENNQVFADKLGNIRSGLFWALAWFLVAVCAVVMVASVLLGVPWWFHTPIWVFALIFSTVRGYKLAAANTELYRRLKAGEPG